MNVNRNFNEILMEIDGGNLHEKLSEALAQLNSAVLATGKTGSLSVTFKVKKNKDSQIFTDTTVKCNPPKEGIATTVFFVDEHGNATRRDPKQADLFPHGIKAVS